MIKQKIGTVGKTKEKKIRVRRANDQNRNDVGDVEEKGIFLYDNERWTGQEEKL